MRQLQRANNILVIAPQATTGGSSVTANIDTDSLGIYSAAKALALEIDVVCGTAVNTNGVNGTVKLLESDDTSVSNFATVVANKTVVVGTASAAAGILSYYIPDIAPRKRYLRVSVSDGTATNDQFSFAVMARALSQEEPAQTADMSSTAVLVV